MAKRQRGYFKHFNDAYQGETLGNIMRKKEYFKGHLFWAIIERANQLNTAEFTESLDYFCRVLSVNLPKLSRELTDFPEFFKSFSVEILEKNVRICIGNYAEYQESRGGKREAKPKQNGFKNDTIKDKRLKIKDVDVETDKKNATKNFELRFNQDFQELQDFLKTAGLLSPKVKNYLPKIYESFGSKNDVMRWLNQKKESTGYKKLKTDNEKKNWFSAVLLDECGVIEIQRRKQGGGV